MHNTLGDVALTNITAEKYNNSIILYSIQNRGFSPFLSLSMFLARF